MAYEAAKRMTLAGVEVKPGDRISKSMIAKFPLGRLDSLRRVGHIREVPDQAPKRRKTAAAPVMETSLEEEAPSIDPAEESVEVSSSPEAST